MVTKILIDINAETKDPFIRITNFSSLSDDTRDKLVKMLLEETGIKGGFMWLHYNPSGDAIVQPTTPRFMVESLSEYFQGFPDIKGALDSALLALGELNKQ